MMESEPNRILKSFGFRLLATLSSLGLLFIIGWFFRILIT